MALYIDCNNYSLQCISFNIRFDSCVEGGESVMLDFLPVIEELKTQYPEHFDTFLRVPATFHRIIYKR